MNYSEKLNPVDWYNKHTEWEDIINIKGVEPYTWVENEHYILDHELIVLAENVLNLKVGERYSKFQWSVMYHEKMNWLKLIYDIQYRRFGSDAIPYKRIGIDYYKVTHFEDVYGINREVLTVWNQQTIKDDYGKAMIEKIAKYDGFCLVPDNKNYQKVIKNRWNQYAPFDYEPVKNDKLENCKHINMIMNHVFGDQIEQGIKYMKTLYDLPKQKLPVLCLVSEERQTGKTTFINFLNMMFGDNYVSISPDDVGGNFNSSYSTKNIIAIDESLIEKQSSTEKIKRIVTAKNMLVNRKFVNSYEIPFYGKIIMCTNKETDFMRIDQAEIRFWIRKLKPITTLITDIEQKMKDEIPMFLGYLNTLPDIETGLSRMVFTPDEIENEEIELTKKESRSELYKILQDRIQTYFEENEHLEEIFARSKDIKEHWFSRNDRINEPYITKVLTKEMNLIANNIRRVPFCSSNNIIIRGRFYTFLRDDYVGTGVEQGGVPADDDLPDWVSGS